MFRHSIKAIRFISISICLAIVAYLSYQWVIYFKEIASTDSSAFIGFLVFIGGYCLVLILLVTLGWGIFILLNNISSALEGHSDRLNAWAIYLVLLLLFWWVVRATFSVEEEFVPENMLLAGIGLAVVIVSKKLFEASRQKQLQLTYEKDRQEAELSLLKAQVNPHFLFNALNTLYNDALKLGATQMTSHLEMLTDILRYQLHFAALKLISLEEELNFIHQFVDFQKHRFQTDKTVEISIDGSISRSDFLIHPMILITFIENAFKHGISREKTSKVQIILQLEKQSLQLTVRNTNFPKVGKMSSGIGLLQAQKLLQAHYPEHQYEVESSDDEYQVNLTLNLQVT